MSRRRDHQIGALFLTLAGVAAIAVLISIEHDDGPGLELPPVKSAAHTEKPKEGEPLRRVPGTNPKRRKAIEKSGIGDSPETTSEVSPATTFFVHHRDEEGRPLGIPGAIILVTRHAESLAPFGNSPQLVADSEGRATLPADIEGALELSLWARGFLPRRQWIDREELAAGGLIPVELEAARRRRVSVTMIALDGISKVPGDRIEMAIPSSCDSLRSRLSVAAFRDHDEIPPLLEKRGQGEIERRPQGTSHLHFNGGSTTRPTAFVTSSAQARWLALFWENVPIQVAAIPEGDETVAFEFHEGTLAYVASECAR